MLKVFFINNGSISENFGVDPSLGNQAINFVWLLTEIEPFLARYDKKFL